MVEINASQKLKVGVARADITPPVGIKSAGFAIRGPLTAFHDPLYAKVVVFELAGQRIVLVSCDLLGLDSDTVSEIRQEIKSRTEIPETAVTIACTHTHYGPDPYRDIEDPMIKHYRANLIHTLGGAVEAAVRGMQPAVLRIGTGESDIGINRREKLPDGRVILGQNSKGVIDRSVSVLRIDGEDGTPLSCIVNFQTHPVSQTGEVDHISADFPGKMCEIVEKLTGAVCMYIQGAAGNINAVRMEPSYEPARTLGIRLGCEVVRLWEICGSPDAIALQPDGIHFTSNVIDLPRTRYGSEANAIQLVISLLDEIQKLETQKSGDGRLDWARLRLKHAQQAVESWSSGVLGDPVQAEVQTWHIGDFAFATAPGEIFNQIGTKIKQQSPFTHTWFSSCTNGSIGYVPIPEAYAEGGYEVTHASQVSSEAAGILTESCLALLRDIMEK